MKKTPEWEYHTERGKWYDIVNHVWGFPSKGDWYLDWDEWRIW